MNVLLVNRLGVGRILLGGEPHKALFEYVNFQRVVASHEYVDPQVKLESVYQVGIRNVLTQHEARLLFYFLLLADNFNSLPTAQGSRLHYVHVFEAFDLPVCCELPVVVG